MATTLVTLRFCDRHIALEDGAEVPAEEMPEFGGMHLDLCEECAKLVRPVAALYAEFGSNGQRTMVPPDAKKEKTHQCPQCQNFYVSRQSLAAHIRKDHGTTIGELEGKEAAYKCKHRGCRQRFTTPQGAAVHYRIKHQAAQSDAGAQPERQSA